MSTPGQLQEYTDRSFIYDQSPCGLFSFLADGTIIAANQTMSEWFGLSDKECIGRNFHTLLEHPSMLYYQLIVDPLIRLNGHISEFSLKFLSSSGEFDGLFNASAHRDLEGRVLVINASVQRINDRKKYEQELLLETRKAEEQRQLAESQKRRFEFLFNSVPNKIWNIDPNGKILNLNGRARDFLATLGKMPATAFAVVSKLDRERLVNGWKACLETEKRFERELRLICADGTEEWFLICAEPYYNNEGDIEMWFCSATNIHRKKLLQIANQQELTSRLASAYKDLDEKSELLAELAADQSHKVRKPLANILGLAKLMHTEATTPEMLEMLLVSAGELDSMVREISAKSFGEPGVI